MIPLEKQCVSLELAKRLKELGVSQVSIFYWDKTGTWVNFSPSVGNGEYSAFTVAELGNILKEYNGKMIPFTEQGWCFLNKKNVLECAYTEADARAKMLIYLVENGLLDKSA